jgi:hypothetical protein
MRLDFQRPFLVHRSCRLFRLTQWEPLLWVRVGMTACAEAFSALRMKGDGMMRK